MVAHRHSIAFLASLFVTACGSKEAADNKGSGAKPTTTAAASPGGDGSSRETARNLAVGSTVTGKLPCEPGKQSVWFRIVPGPIIGSAKVEIRTPKEGNQSCVHFNAFDASGKLVDTVASPCSDQKDFAVGEGPLNDRETTFELLSSMGTCYPSEYRITVAKAK